MAGTGLHGVLETVYAGNAVSQTTSRNVSSRYILCHM